MKKILNTKLRAFLISENASVRLINMLAGCSGRDEMTVAQFIKAWPMARLKKVAYGFGPKNRKEFREILERHACCKNGRRFADYVASLREPEPERTCVHCGCTDSRACPGGCFWTEKHSATPTGVCSRCVSVVQTGPLRPFRIGEFIFTRTSPKEVFIQHPQGDGMQSTDMKLNPVIHQFFNSEF